MINTSVNQNPTPPFGTAAEPVSVNEENSIKHISKPNTQSGKEVTIVSEVNPNVGKHQVQHEDVFGVDLIQRMCDGVGGLKPAAWEVYEKVIYPYQLLMQGVPVTPQKGIILYGPPGTGKSLLASRIVQAMGVKGDNTRFIKSAEVLANNPEPSVANLKKIFKPAEDAQKSGDGVSEIFTFCFDEIDAMLMPEKEWDLPSKSQEAIRLELQSMLSGPQSYNNIIVIGTTNLEPSRFPAALKRQGRLSVQISISYPDQVSRYEILQIFCHKLEGKGWNCKDLNLDSLSCQTAGKSGADLEQLVNDAVVISVNEYEMAKRAKSMQSEVVSKPKTLISRHFLGALSNSSDIKLSKSKVLDRLSVAHPFTPLLKQEQKIIYPALKAINRVTGATGRYGVIVVKGDSQTGKTAICRQLVERATGFDNFQVITEVKSDLSIANMARATIDALENANNYRNSLIVIDDFDSLLLDKNPCWSPDKVFRLWRRLTGKSEGKNIALLVTTCMDLNELVKISTLKEIREYIHLPDKLTQNEINELMTAWDVDQQAKKDISRIFAEGCPVKEFHNLFEHYKNDPLEEGGSVTWDIEGMKRDFQRGRVISEQKSMSAFGIYS